MTKKDPLHLPARLHPTRLEAGIDEVGRGCLAGPVVAAAVILSEDFDLPGLTDSKQLTAHRREDYDLTIREKAIAVSVGSATVEEIDRLNILGATFLAMERAIEGLEPRPEYLLIDGNRFRSHLEIPYETIVGGDGRVASIAAASIVAKVYRDHLMAHLAEEYPEYHWERNAGYGTAVHLAAIRSHGLTPHHRRTFAPCRPTLFDR